MPEQSSNNTSDISSVSSLTNIEEDECTSNTIPFPELEIPEINVQLPSFKSQPSLHRMKTDPFPFTSATPDYNLAEFFASAQPKPEMAVETPHIFHGNGHPLENPANFLKSFKHAMRQQAITTSSDKLDTFGDYLGTNSQAERWFKALPSTDKADWATFMAAFETRWLPVVVAEKTKVEYEKELLEHKL
ncbi:hypothetical protein BDR07DRAFT_1480393 [Suillus spraguei]|nr:hypothetical protein BDR07DRAFT_1480393 [Suillus spraguei]